MPKKTPVTKKDFAQQFAELESIVDSLESQADGHFANQLKDFERGLRLAADLRKQLSSAEQSIETLKKKYDPTK